MILFKLIIKYCYILILVVKIKIYFKIIITNENQLILALIKIINEILSNQNQTILISQLINH